MAKRRKKAEAFSDTNVQLAEQTEGSRMVMLHRMEQGEREAVELSEPNPELQKFEESVDEQTNAQLEAQAEAEVAEEAAKPNSVVAPKYKDKYLEAARANGWRGKAAKRSNWDWLSQQVAAVCLNEKGKIRIGDFLALLEANGVDYSRWQNRNKGWEGRLRMTGRVALQKVVANSGVLKFPDFMSVKEAAAPDEWAAKFKDKKN